METGSLEVRCLNLISAIFEEWRGFSDVRRSKLLEGYACFL